MVFGRRGAYTALAVLVAVLVAAVLLLAAPAWSKDTPFRKDSERTGEATTRKGASPVENKASGPGPVRDVTSETGSARTGSKTSEHVGEKTSKESTTQAKSKAPENSGSLTGPGVGIQDKNGDGSVNGGDTLTIPGDYEISPDTSVTVKDENGTQSTFDDQNAKLSLTNNGDLKVEPTRTPGVQGGKSKLKTGGLKLVKLAGVRRGHHKHTSTHHHTNRSGGSNRGNNITGGFTTELQNDPSGPNINTDNQTTGDTTTGDTTDPTTTDQTTGDTTTGDTTNGTTTGGVTNNTGGPGCAVAIAGGVTAMAGCGETSTAGNQNNGNTGTNTNAGNQYNSNTTGTNTNTGNQYDSNTTGTDTNLGNQNDGNTGTNTNPGNQNSNAGTGTNPGNQNSGNTGTNNTGTDTNVSAQSGDNFGSGSDTLGNDTSGSGIDDQAPVDGPQGDVIDEVNTDGLLPETGGLPPETGGLPQASRLPIAALTPPLGIALVVAVFAVWRFGARRG